MPHYNYRKYYSWFVLGVALYFVGLNPVLAQKANYEQAYSDYQNKQFADAETAWLKLANNGDMNAQYALGVMNLRNEAKDSSPAAALSWFEKAASQGHPTAMYNVGVAYWEGNGVAQDKPKALSLWQQAADRGDSGAQFNLGLAHYIGTEAEPDLKLAHSWFRLAAEQDHEEARHMLKVVQAELQAPAQPAVVTAPQTLPVVSEAATETAAKKDAVPAQSNQSIVKKNTDTAPEKTSEQTASANQQQPQATLNSYWKTGDTPAMIFDKPDGTGFRELSAGTPVDVKDRKGDWAEITAPDGLRTWIFAKYIKIDGNAGVISGNKVRIRPEPSTDNKLSPPLGYYIRGDRLQVLSNRKDWIEVRAPKNITAWTATGNIVEYEDTAENRAAAWRKAQANGA